MSQRLPLTNANPGAIPFAPKRQETRETNAHYAALLMVLLPTRLLRSSLIIVVIQNSGVAPSMGADPFTPSVVPSTTAIRQSASA